MFPCDIVCWLDFYFRLLDIVHADQKLYLVFEFLDVDLKRYMETGNQNRTPISLDIVKVSHLRDLCLALPCDTSTRLSRDFRDFRDFDFLVHLKDFFIPFAMHMEPLFAATVCMMIHLSRIFAEIYVSTKRRSPLLPLPSHSTSRSQATESPHR